MDNHFIIPVVMFVCITYAVKLVVDARMRYLLWRSGGSEEAIRALMQTEERMRRHAALRWGVIALALSAGFGLIQAAGWQYITPGVIAVLAAATGVGNLVFFAISRRLD